MLEELTGYVIKELIYQGMHSLIYRAVRVKDQRSVILKVLNREYPTQQELNCFQQEYEIAQQLMQLDGVIKAYQLLDYYHTKILVLEDIGGISLFEYITQLPPNITTSIGWIKSIAETLDLLHQKKIIHKDINPSNIILNPENGILKVIDFGIASRLERSRQKYLPHNQLEGTLAYIAPEQTGRMNLSLDYRADYYSLGVMFYQLLTKQLPFNAKGDLELVHAHIAQQVIPLSESFPDIPKVLSDIIVKLMAKNPAQRYQSHYGLMQDLNYAMQNKESTKDFVAGKYDHSTTLLIPQKLYGREKEIQQLQQAVKKIKKQKALLWISGISGIGKSSLVNEVYKPLTEIKGRFIKGKIDQFQRTTPYSAIKTALSQLIQILLSESQETLNAVKLKLKKHLHPNTHLLINFLSEFTLLLGETTEDVSEPKELMEYENRFQITICKLIQCIATKETPLVIFLDDMQWMDETSLHLLQLIIGDNSLKYILLIGTWRDNEVSTEHPLLTTVKKLNVLAYHEEVLLQAIDQSAITRLLRDILYQDNDDIIALSQLIYHKTAGNPFFIHQFIQHLYTQKLLILQKGKWCWDLEIIKEQPFMDNVIDIMRGTITALPNKTRILLHQAACIGNQFYLKELSAINGKSEDIVAELLWPAIEMELIDAKDPVAGLRYQSYSFIHDKIQQSAFNLYDNKEKTLIYLNIAQFRQKSYQDNIDAHLFAIVNPWNLAKDLITTETQQYQLARYNAKAGDLARSSGVLKLAEQYYLSGITLLSDTMRTKYYSLYFDLTLHRGECLFLMGKKRLAHQILDTLLLEAQHKEEKIRIYTLRSLLFIGAEEYSEAITAGLTALALSGLTISLEEEVLQQQLESIIMKIENKWQLLEQDLSALPAAKEQMTSIIELCVRLMPAAFVIGNTTLYWILANYPLAFTLSKGINKYSGLAYCFYAMFIQITQGDYQRVYLLGKKGLELEAQNTDPSIKSRHYFHRGNFFSHWKEDISKILKYLQLAYREAVYAGDMLYYTYYAKYCIAMVKITVGIELCQLEQELEAYYAQMASYNIQRDHTMPIIVYSQFIKCLQGKTVHFLDMSDKEYNWKTALTKMQTEKLHSEICLLYMLQILLEYLFDDWDNALQHVEAVQPYAHSHYGIHKPYIAHGIKALILAAIMLREKKTQHAEYRPAFDQEQQLLQTWNGLGTNNFTGLYHFVRAEAAWMDEQYFEAINAYQAAIQGAKQIGHLWLQAKVNERAGKFFIAHHLSRYAESHLTEAYYLYKKWGALTKCRQLKKDYLLLFVQPTLLQENATAVTVEGSQHLTSSSVKSNLDINTVVKATLALSSTLSLNSLISNMLGIALESAGAQKSILILQHKDKYYVEGKISFKGQEIVTEHILQHILLEQYIALPKTLLQYVINKPHTLVLYDAKVDNPFQQDLWFIQHPEIRSVLCLPIQIQQRLLGILYFEHAESPGVFYEQRQELLKLIAAQAAISIENATLYDSLEEKVKERTQALQQAQTQLVKQAREAGMAEIAIEMMHNIGNNMTPLKTYIELSYHGLKNSIMLKKLNPLLNMLEQGIKEPQSVSEREQKKLLKIIQLLPDVIKNDYLENVQHLTSAISTLHRIEEFIHLQTKYTEVKQLKTHLSLNSLIKDALAMLESILDEEAIQVDLDLFDSPLIWGEEYPLVQILLGLFKNAIEAMSDVVPEIRKLTIRSLVDKEGYIVLDIEDCGRGFTPESKEQIFAANYPNKSVSFSEGKGRHIAGFKLHTCANYLIANGAFIDGNSKGTGQGAVFTLRFPIIE